MTYKPMETKKIYDEVLKFFDVKELISRQCYNQYKVYGDYFFLSKFNIRLLETLIFIRKELNRKITVNNWCFGGRLQERGLRDNQTEIVRNKKNVYLSAHVLGSAIDFDVEGMKAYEVRKWLVSVADALPYPIRLEHKLRGAEITWVHLDVLDEPKNPKVYLFNV